MAVTGSPNAQNFHGSPIRKKHGDKARMPRRVRQARNRSSSIGHRTGHTWKVIGEHETRVAVHHDEPARTVQLPTVEIIGGEWKARKGGKNAQRANVAPNVYPAVFSAPGFASEIVEKRAQKQKAEKGEPAARLSNKHSAPSPTCAPLDGATETLSRDEWTVLSISRQGNRKGPAPYVVRAKQGKYVKVIAIRKAANLTDCKAQLATIHGITV